MKTEDYFAKIAELNTAAFECYSNGNLNDAKDYFQQLKKINSYDKDTYYNLAKVCYELKDYSACIDILLELLSIGDENDQTFELLGDAYIPLGNFSEALLCYKRVLDTALVKEKVETIKEFFEKSQDKLYLQYTNYPYPNAWKISGIPEIYSQLRNCNAFERRRTASLSPSLDINFIQLKYWEKYKSLEKLRVLNAGCGTGEGLVSSAFFYPEVEYVAIDISQKSINIAKEHAEKLGITNIKFIQMDITKVDSEELGHFDIIVSTGVLHHLYDPKEGIVSLKKVLKEGGILAGMVYANTGRREIYDFRDIFHNLFSEIEQTEYKLGVTRQLIEILQPWQRLDRIKLFPDINYSEGLVDLLLNENETSYSTLELKKLFESKDLNIDFYHNDYLDPLFPLYNISNTAIRRRINLLSKETKIRIAEILNGSIYKHRFIAYDKGFRIKQRYILEADWIETYPIFNGEIVFEKNDNIYYINYNTDGKIGEGVSKYVLSNEKSKNYYRYDVTKKQYDFLNECNGTLSIKQIIENLKLNIGLGEIKKLIFELNQKDILFLSKQEETEYKG